MATKNKKKEEKKNLASTKKSQKNDAASGNAKKEKQKKNQSSSGNKDVSNNKKKVTKKSALPSKSSGNSSLSGKKDTNKKISSSNKKSPVSNNKTVKKNITSSVPKKDLKISSELKKDRKKTEEKKQKDKKESKEKTVKPNSPLTSGNKKKNDSDKSISKLSLLEDEILSLSDSEFETEPTKELIEPIEGEPIVPTEPIEPVVVDEEEELGDEELDLIPEKKGRGRKKKSESTSGSKYSGSEVSIRNKPLDMSIIEKSLPIKNTQKQPKPYTGNTDNRTRYSDKELAEFKEIILKKLAEAQHDYEQLKEQINSENDHGTDDTSPTFKLMEDGSELMTKAELTQLALRQEKYINSLKNALIRIENKTYGICRVTGKLIPKERLKIVPHATLSLDAKLSQND